MTDHPNVQRLREGYEAFSAGNFAVLEDLWAHDIRWHTPGHGQLSGLYEGPAAIFGLFGRVMELTDGTFRVQPLALLADDTYGVAVVMLTGRRDGLTLQVQNAQVSRFEGDRVVEFWDTSTDQDALDEFFP